MYGISSFGVYASAPAHSNSLTGISRGSSTTDSYSSLSSGVRVNRDQGDAAKVNPLTLASVQSQVRTPTIRSINNSISRLNIKEGALKALGTVLLRHKNARVEAQNEARPMEDRVKIAKHADELVHQYDKIVSTAAFEGERIFNGSDATLSRSNPKQRPSIEETARLLTSINAEIKNVSNERLVLHENVEALRPDEGSEIIAHIEQAEASAEVIKEELLKQSEAALDVQANFRRENAFGLLYN